MKISRTIFFNKSFLYRWKYSMERTVHDTNSFEFDN